MNLSLILAEDGSNENNASKFDSKFWWLGTGVIRKLLGCWMPFWVSKSQQDTYLPLHYAGWLQQRKMLTNHGVNLSLVSTNLWVLLVSKVNVTDLIRASDKDLSHINPKWFLTYSSVVNLQRKTRVGDTGAWIVGMSIWEVQLCLRLQTRAFGFDLTEPPLLKVYMTRKFQ